MARCLHLAQLGEGAVAPNPMVGAVLVYNDSIIGEGYHQAFGGPHAEVTCIASVADSNRPLIQKSTLYVSLEPCSHFGKTPPCADLIIQHKIPRVVIACTDPYKEVSGRGIKKLEEAGIEVAIGVLKKLARQLNKRFVLFQEQARPYIILKWAQTADGFIAASNYQPVAISTSYTNRLVHRWRSQNMGLLVGTNTALHDDPQLNSRLWPGSNPTRLVIDRNLRLPKTLKLFDRTQPTIVFNELKQEENKPILYHRIDKGNVIPQIVKALADYKIQSVMVEGGAQLQQSFIGSGLWDEALVITNTERSLSGGIAAPKLQGHRLVEQQTISTDIIHTYANLSNDLL